MVVGLSVGEGAGHAMCPENLDKHPLARTVLAPVSESKQSSLPPLSLSLSRSVRYRSLYRSSAGSSRLKEAIRTQAEERPLFSRP